MSTKLPKGASHWWNKPNKDLTPEQQEIKRKYARELYQKTKSRQTTNQNEEFASLQRENEFLRIIIENYGTNLKELFDNVKMTDEHAATPEKQMNLTEFKQYCKKAPEYLCDAPVETFIPLVATGASLIKCQTLVYPKSKGSAIQLISEFALTTEKVVLDMVGHILHFSPKYNSSIICGFRVQGRIKKVVVTYTDTVTGTSIESSYGDIHGNECIFDPPLPIPYGSAPTASSAPTGSYLGIITYFDNSLGLDNHYKEVWPKIIMSVTTGVFSNETSEHFATEKLLKEILVGDVAND